MFILSRISSLSQQYHNGAQLTWNIRRGLRDNSRSRLCTCIQPELCDRTWLRLSSQVIWLSSRRSRWFGRSRERVQLQLKEFNVEAWGETPPSRRAYLHGAAAASTSAVTTWTAERKLSVSINHSASLQRRVISLFSLFLSSPSFSFHISRRRPRHIIFVFERYYGATDL